MVRNPLAYWFLSFAFLLTLSGSFWSCGQPVALQQAQTAIPALPPVLAFDLQKKSAASLSQLRAVIWQAWQKGVPPTSSELAGGLTLELAARSALKAKKLDQARAEFTRLLKRWVPTSDPHAVKTQWDSLVGRPRLKYQRDQRDVFQILETQQLQCESGTLAYEMARLKNAALIDTSEQRPVVIAQSGHVLPGYMVWTAGAWELMGVEMTVGGRGRVQFGPTAQLNRAHHGAMRILHAEYFLALTLFGEQMADRADYLERALAATATAYGIPRATIEPNRDPRNGEFYFGQADVSAEEKERADRDDENRRIPEPQQSGVGAAVVGSVIEGRTQGLGSAAVEFDLLVTRGEDGVLLVAERSANLEQLFEEGCQGLGYSFLGGLTAPPAQAEYQWLYEDSANRMLIAAVPTYGTQGAARVQMHTGEPVYLGQKMGSLRFNPVKVRVLCGIAPVYR